MKTPAALLCLLFLAIHSSPAAPAGGEIDIPFAKFTLKNGLTVIVHEDRKAPVVATSVWYHVGSKNEKPGRTGFAHLFEHLMFNGSEHYNDDWFKALEKVGATSTNGTTSEDRTNYFQTVPKEALDFALWMESDRMGHLLGAIDQARLDEQRGVVQNEKRQNENQPYGMVPELITRATYPAGHPYSWTVIGSMQDLNAAALNDVRDWFKAYYGAANATLVIAGDIDPETARQKAELYFGDIPPGPPVARFTSWIAKRNGSQREVTEDRVPQARIHKVWNTPAYADAASAGLSLVADILASGKTSRLYKRLVYDEQIASEVSASASPSEIGGQFYITATARPGQDLAAVERAVNEELARFIAEGPTPDELERVKTEHTAGFIRGIERVGGFGGKANTLAESQVFGGSPDFYKTVLRRTREATPGELREAAKQWLSDGVYTLEVHPFPPYATAQTGADRAKFSPPDIQPETKFPTFERATLGNGLKIIIAERHGVPLVSAQLLVDAGFAADSPASRGTARLAADMLDEGTKTRTALEISDELSRLGAVFGAGCDLDTTSLTVSALREKLDPTLELFADIALRPSFPEADFKRLQKQQIDAIEREKAEPAGLASRLFPRFIYGAEHPYAVPFSGLGSGAAVAKLTAADARKFHETWFHPNNATLIVVGDTTMATMKPRLEKLFGAWARASVPEKKIGTVGAAPQPVIYLVDRPGSIQSAILAGHVAPPKNDPDDIAIGAMNLVLGGTFTSRINMNLREDKHWSYGAGTRLQDARGQRPFAVRTSVQTDKTAESVIEIAKELRGVAGGRPITGEELAKAQKSETLTLPGAWETIGSVAGAIAEITRFGLPDDYYGTFAGKVRALTVENLNHAAVSVVKPDALVWVIVGDRAKIESGLRKAGIGEVRIIDADGNLLAVGTPP